MKEENSIEEYNIAILSCSTKIEREGMIIEQNYDFYDNDVSQSRILVQRQEFKSKGEKYNEVFDIYVQLAQKNLTKKSQCSEFYFSFATSCLLIPIGNLSFCTLALSSHF